MKVDPQFVELYEREHERVFQVTFALCRDLALAEDATQEAFARALERWTRLRDRPWVGGWVMRHCTECSAAHASKTPVCLLCAVGQS